jgi:hypothetical protein
MNIRQKILIKIISQIPLFPLFSAIDKLLMPFDKNSLIKNKLAVKELNLKLVTPSSELKFLNFQLGQSIYTSIINTLGFNLIRPCLILLEIPSR